MDSGNSGSLQSSSGGDDEYDSRSESAPAFLNSFLSHHQNQQQPTFFDPSSNYLRALSQSQPNSNPSSLLNLDLVGSSSLRSEPNCTNGGNHTSSHSILATQGLNHVSFSTSSSMQSRGLNDNGARSLAPSDHQTNVVKNPKKRTRTSRRAPTTVLTTDTSNFRAMVQEFTGIPASPFSGSSYSRRIDLFGSGSGSGIRSGNLETMGPLYPLRPTTQKFQPNSFASSSSVIDAIAASTSTIASSTNDNTITTSISATSHNSFHSPSNNNYQLLPDLGLNKEPQNMLNLQQNQSLSFQSLLQSPLNPSLNIPGFGAKSQGSFIVPAFEDHLGMSHGHVNLNSSIGGLPSHVSSGQDHLRSFDGNYGNSSQRVASCKLNYSASSSDFHHDKSLENVSSRGEGTVDSWICPSD